MRPAQGTAPAPAATRRGAATAGLVVTGRVPALNVDANFVTGLSNPWDMAFLPDGTMFFTERAGSVRARLPNGSINDVVAPVDVSLVLGSGMMGLALDPNFASNRFLYTFYTAPNENRVVRWQVNNTLNGVVGDRNRACWDRQRGRPLRLPNSLRA